jgi:hypothetical protein
MVGHYNGAKPRSGGPLARQASLFDEDWRVPLMLELPWREIAGASCPLA